ncbi:50S ribosomal protein L25, partial [Pseudomonas sp. BGM005]|nr:50S ribosomal protein L25 [Pseudomonas sp. BG5]
KGSSLLSDPEVLVVAISIPAEEPLEEDEAGAEDEAPAEDAAAE